MGTKSEASLGFADELWSAVDELRGAADAYEYMHAVLGLIFLKYLSDAFLEKHEELRNAEHADPEDRDAYEAHDLFWLPPEARWGYLMEHAGEPRIGETIDKAMSAIEQENPTLKGVPRQGYARSEFGETRLGELVVLISTVGSSNEVGARKGDLGHIYEYLLARFAEKKGKGSGEFHTPECLSKLLVEMVEPFEGNVFDPCCGSGGTLIQATHFAEARADGDHGMGVGHKIHIFGQEINDANWQLARMNMITHGVDARIEHREKGAFLQGVHQDMKADCILAHPPLGVRSRDFSNVGDDVFWKYGPPLTSGSTDYVWIQYFAHHLTPNGVAGFMMANGSMFTNSPGRVEIREGLIEDDMVDCMVALPGQLLYGVQIPICLWILVGSKKANVKHGLRARVHETLFIDARRMGHLVSHTRRVLSDEDINQICHTYHAWRGRESNGAYQDRLGFCRSATLPDIRANHYTLVPGRYVGMAPIEDDGMDIEEKIAGLADQLYKRMRESQKLDAEIRKNLESLGHEE